MQSNLTTQRRLARGAGLLYIVLIITGVFAEFGVRRAMLVSGDAAATAQNMLTSTAMFRLGFFSDLVGQLAFLLLGLLLYTLFQPYGRLLAQTFLVCVVASVAIQSLNTLNQMAALLALTSSASVAAFTTAQLQAQASFFLELHTYGYLIAQVFFGFWLIPLGLLGLRSRLIPRWISALLLLGAAADLSDVALRVLAPGYGSSVQSIIEGVSALAEFSLVLWLLIRGVSATAPAPQTPVAQQGV